jgi:outer membrane protein TolC
MCAKFNFKNKNAAILILLGLVVPFNSFSQKTLEYYLEAARNNNPVIKENFAMADKVAIAEKRIKAEYVGPQSYLTGDIFYPPMIGDKNDPDAIGYDIAITDGGLYACLLNIRQPIFTRTINETRLHQVKIAGETNREKANLSLHQLEKDVTDRYILAFQSLNQIGFANKVKSQLEEQKKIIEVLAEQGIYKRSDILMIDIQIQDQNTEINNLNSIYQRNIYLLNDLCGINEDPDMVLSAPEIELIPGSLQTQFINKFKLDSLQEIANLQVLNLKYKPKINIYGNTGVNAIEMQGIQRKFGVGVGLSLLVPIYDGYQKKLNTQESEINLQIIDNYKQNFLIQKTNREKAAISELKSIDERIVMLRRQLDNYINLLQLLNLQVRSGELEIINYMNTIKSFIKSKNDLTINETNRLLIINENNYYTW